MILRARILSFIGWFVISLWCRTLRIRFVDRDIPENLTAEGKNFIYAFWHGRQLLLLYGHRGSGYVVPSSESRDGEIQAGILRRFGYDVVRGSSRRKGERALLGLVNALRKGTCIALAVDGPRGPIYEVKQGITYLAGKLEKPIIPVIMSAGRYWILEKIWDKYMLPKPFSRCVIMYGEPIGVNGISEEELESKRKVLAEALNALMEKADRSFSR